MLPYIYNDIERVKEDIEEEFDNPVEYEIHKLKYTLQVEEVYKREIVYSLVAERNE